MIYTWDGEEVSNVVLSNVYSSTSGTNVQGIYVKDGVTYLMITHWAKNGMFVVRLDLDYSVLN